MAELLPPDLLRFLFLRHKPNRAIDFDPGGDTIPRLFDEFDRIADAVAGRPTKGELPPDFERIFALSLADPDADPRAVADAYRPPFAHLALLLQVPGADLDARLAAEKGAPLTDAELAIVRQREAAARTWLEQLAPDKARVSVHYDGLPASAAELDDGQRRFLVTLARAVEAEPPASGEGWQAAVFEAAREAGLEPGTAFAALYGAFLGRPNGPRAGWLLASLDSAFVIDRLRAAGGVLASHA
jgi:lysyl-tRNA synthetase class 1